MKIFIIGFMGCGKTYWGKIWSEHYDMSFIDMDDVIEKEQGKTIDRLFKEEGETKFRTIETEKLRELRDCKNTIIACGGGTPCFHSNMEWMNIYGETVYIKSSALYLLNRIIQDNSNKRPALKNLPLLESFIQEKLDERESFYNKSRKILDVKTLGLDSLDYIINTPLQHL